MVERRRVDPAVECTFQASMRNDFLTPGGTPYKWQEMTASLSRAVSGTAVPTVVPVRYRWQRVDARTGTPTTAGDRREWTFARGQSFSSFLPHTDVDGGVEDAAAAAPGSIGTALTIAYPQLPKAPAVDLLLMLSWDVVTFELMCTHLITTPGLRTVGGSAELQRVGGTWGEMQFSNPDAVAVFRNARATARHLGYGRFAERPSAVYSWQCLDCELESRSGLLTQQGRSSYWATVQVDVETGDLLSAEMTEMIVAVQTGADGQRVQVQKRRLVEMHASVALAAVDDTELAGRTSTTRAAKRTRAAKTGRAAKAERAANNDRAMKTDGATKTDRAAMTKLARLAGRVADHVRWQTMHMGSFPPGMGEFALMGFQTLVGADPTETYRQIRLLRTGLQATVRGEPGAGDSLQAVLPDHRRLLEGLLAFGEASMDEEARQRFPERFRRAYEDEQTRKALDSHMRTVRGDITELLASLERLEGARST